MKVFSQKREIKQYEVDPFVTVEDGDYCVRVDKSGFYFLQWRKSSMQYERICYQTEGINEKLIRRALEEWDKVK